MLKYYESSGVIVNKSHALAYSLITYQNAYLKANYPVQYMMALLTSRVDKPDKLQRYINEARSMGIIISPPSVNSSELGFKSQGNNTILFGLSAIMGIGETVANKILEAREAGEFKDIFDFMERVDRSKVNSRSIEILVKCGAFDEFGYSRELLHDRLPLLQQYYEDKLSYLDAEARADQRDSELEEWAEKFNDWEILKKAGKVVKLKEPEIIDGEKTSWLPPRPKKPVAIKRKELPTVPDLSDIIDEDDSVSFKMIAWEAEYCKFFISAHPLDFVTLPEGFTHTYIEDIDPVICKTGTALVTVIGIEEKKIKNGASKGKSMGIITVQDNTGNAELTVFPNQYSLWPFTDLKIGDVLTVRFKADGDSGENMKRLLLGGQVKRINNQNHYEC